MTNKDRTFPYRSIIAIILSLLFCGFGQIYLHRIYKGVILMVSFLCAIFIIWMAVSNVDFKIMSFGEKQLRFVPAEKSIFFMGKTIYVADIMRITGFIQLAFTWVFSVVDAWWEGRN